MNTTHGFDRYGCGDISSKRTSQNHAGGENNGLQQETEGLVYEIKGTYLLKQPKHLGRPLDN